jgi:hypothetical protein
MSDDDVLRLYEMHWNQYKNQCRYLNSCCQYLNRHWVRREYDSGRKDVKEIGPVRYFYFLLFFLIASPIF